MKFLQSIFQKLLGNGSESIIALTNPQWDVMVFAFLFITTLFYGLGLTRNKIFTFLLSTYIALALVDSLPYVSSWWVGTRNTDLDLWEAFLAVVIFIMAFIFVNLVLKKHSPSSAEGGGLMYNFILSFFHVGFVISIILSSFPLGARAIFLPFTQRLFMGEIARFFWFITPLLAVLLMQKKDIENEHEHVEKNQQVG